MDFLISGGFLGGVVWGPLHGLPVTLKENFCVQGWNCGSHGSAVPEYVSNMPELNSAIAQRLLDAGAKSFC